MENLVILGLLDAFELLALEKATGRNEDGLEVGLSSHRHTSQSGR